MLDASYELAKYVVQTKFEDLPAEVVEGAKLNILDTLGVAALGSRFESAEKLMALADELGGKPESTIIGYAVAGKDIKVIAENTTTGWYKIEFVDVDGKTLTGYIASDAKYFVQDKNTSTEVDTTEATEAGSEAATASESK